MGLRSSTFMGRNVHEQTNSMRSGRPAGHPPTRHHRRESHRRRRAMPCRRTLPGGPRQCSITVHGHVPVVPSCRRRRDERAPAERRGLLSAGSGRRATVMGAYVCAASTYIAGLALATQSAQVASLLECRLATCSYRCTVHEFRLATTQHYCCKL